MEKYKKRNIYLFSTANRLAIICSFLNMKFFYSFNFMSFLVLIGIAAVGYIFLGVCSGNAAVGDRAGILAGHRCRFFLICWLPAAPGGTFFDQMNHFRGPLTEKIY